ncbi:MAG: ABC transporter substrate-binding protein, partial [Gammaproteobacteria bacterium]|nr:ABC transporter substrate-binding protein [Gammaproteobacteria bacterium]
EVAALRRDRDCIGRFRERVLGAGLLAAAELAAADAEIAAAVDAAFSVAAAAAPPEPAALLRDVYAGRL